jgi:hypothetical protein
MVEVDLLEYKWESMVRVTIRNVETTDYREN